MDQVDEDGFVVLEPDENFKFEQNRHGYFAQMETILNKQLDMCKFYIKQLENDQTMLKTFTEHQDNTQKYLESLKERLKTNDLLPKFKFETVQVNSLPTNVDVQDKELQLVINSSNLPVDQGSVIYVIAEFEFPYTKDEALGDTLSRYAHRVKIEPSNMFQCCAGIGAKQVDMIYATNMITLIEPDAKLIEYDRPVSFFVDKGRSRTLKRKFKPIKLIFYEKTGILRMDKRLGHVLVRIEEINDQSTISMKLPIINNRKETSAIAKVTVKVREPLVDKSSRAHDEKLLIVSL